LLPCSGFCSRHLASVFCITLDPGNPRCVVSLSRVVQRLQKFGLSVEGGLGDRRALPRRRIGVVDPMREAASTDHPFLFLMTDDVFCSIRGHINLQCLHPSPASSRNVYTHRRDACLILLLGANSPSDLGASQGKKSRDWSTYRGSRAAKDKGRVVVPLLIGLGG
jgi:hypothetical protein